MTERALNEISVCAWNMRGFEIAIPYLRHLMSKFQIVCVSEHWLCSNQLNKFSDIDSNFDYVCHASSKSSAETYGRGRGQGGVGILWHKRLGGVTPICEVKHDRFCAIRVQTPTGNVINIFSVYMPSPGSDDDLSTTLDELSAVLESMEPESVNLICGDLNGDLGSLPGCRGVKSMTQAGGIVNDFCIRHQFWVSNLCKNAMGPIFTHYGPTGQSTIDYILVPYILRGKTVKYGVAGDHVLNTSDHNPVFVVCDIKTLPNLHINGNNVKSLRWDKIKDDVREVKYTQCVDLKMQDIYNTMHQPLLCESDVDDILCEIVKSLHEAASGLPRTRFRKHLKPYWCPEMDSLKQEKIKAYKRWVQEGRPREVDNHARVIYLATKKAFNKRLHFLAREYEDENLRQVMSSAEMDCITFWQVLNRNRAGNKSKVYAIQNEGGKIVHSIEEVLEVWRRHFSKLCTPSHDSMYDQEHYVHVNRCIEGWLDGNDDEEFLRDEFTFDEVTLAISKLNMGKSTGMDGISAEHLKYGGKGVGLVLTAVYNSIVHLEYIPKNFREGIQVPLHKGKNTSVTDTDNYRGITLLNTFCKIFEILIWSRMETWWMGKISTLQGASRKGVSCLHTAMVLQETIASKLELGKKVFITYFDVSKAFDSVWVNGLFYQLRKFGIVGRLWRLLYKMYIDFRCRVRIGGTLSEWYSMTCGIHQGGYLSLVKYISFIDSLVTELEASKLCCAIEGLNVSPVSYADDLATASLTKYNVDKIMVIAVTHSRKWRYKFNARKSAVLVYGETNRESAKYRTERSYQIGRDRVVEKSSYDHVGVKSCINGNFDIRTTEKIKKGRRAFYSVLGIGIKRRGLNLSTCNLIFWSLVVPITLFGSELWVLNEQDVQNLDGFQRQIGRRMQRFHNRSPSNTCVRSLGWMRLETFVYAKKVLFLRTILCMGNDSIYKKILIQRLKDFENDRDKALVNEFYSPLYDIFRVTIMFGMMHMAVGMLNGSHFFSKQEWKKAVWKNAWVIDNREWEFTSSLFADTHYLRQTMSVTQQYLTWWEISNMHPWTMYMCENLASLVCRASTLKSDAIEYRGANLSDRACVNCEMFQEENVEHMVMQCPHNSDLRELMLTRIYELERTRAVKLIKPGEFIYNLLGKYLDGIDIDVMMDFWIIAGNAINKMYERSITSKKGIG